MEMLWWADIHLFKSLLMVGNKIKRYKFNGFSINFNTNKISVFIFHFVLVHSDSHQLW